MTTESIKLTRAALDELGKEIVIRGVIDPSALSKLKVAPYQREILSLTIIHELMEAIKGGGVPDICLGMRGGSFIEREGAFYLQDPVFIVDGLQRTTAAIEVMKSGDLPHLGAIVYCNTTEKGEREKFRILNSERSKLSPNVLLRNMKYDNELVRMLYDLSNDSSFTLHHKVCWQQRMKREELITAVGLLKVSSRLHSKFKTGLLDFSYYDLAQSLQKVLERVGRKAIRDNTVTFWSTIDEIWDIKHVTFKEGAPYLRQSFVITLAKLFADHQDFWDDSKFKISIDLKRKLSLFPLKDPQVAHLCSGSGPTLDILYNMLIQHINSGRRIRRLTPFVQEVDEPEFDEQSETGEEE